MPSESYLKLESIIDGKFEQLNQAVKDFGRTEADYETDSDAEEIGAPAKTTINAAEIEDACELLDAILAGGNPFQEQAPEENDFLILDSIIDDTTPEEMDAAHNESLPNEDEEAVEENVEVIEEETIEEAPQANENDSNTSSPVIGVSAFDKRNMNSHWLSEDEDGTTRWETYQQTRELLHNSDENDELNADTEIPDVESPQDENSDIVENEVPLEQDNKQNREEDFDDFDELEFDIDFEDESFSEVIVDAEDEYDDDIFSTYVESTEYDEETAEELPEETSDATDETDETFETYYYETEDDEIPTMNYAAGTLGPIDDNTEDVEEPSDNDENKPAMRGKSLFGSK